MNVYKIELFAKNYCRSFEEPVQVSKFLHCLYKMCRRSRNIKETVVECYNKVSKGGVTKRRLYEIYENLHKEISGKICILSLIVLIETLSKIFSILLRFVLSGLKGRYKIEYICNEKIIEKVLILYRLIIEHVLKPCRQLVIVDYQRPLSYVIISVYTLLVADIIGQYGCRGRLVRDAMILSDAILRSCQFLSQDLCARRLFESMQGYLLQNETLKRFIEHYASIQLGDDIQCC